jgi:GNAT superfamily N-acetyltransferase
VAPVAKSASRKVEILTATAEHRPLLDAFFKTVWPSERRATGDAGGSEPPNAPDQRELSPSTIAVQDGRIIGYLGTLPLKLWDGSRESNAHWYKGFMVLPEFRNGPLGFGLVREAEKRLPIAVVITVQPASWRLFKAAGLSHVGALDNRLRLLRPGRVIARLNLQTLGVGGLPRGAEPVLQVIQRLRLAGLAGGLVRGALAAWSAARGSAGRRVRTAVVTTITAGEYDGLWSRVRPAIRFAQVRDADYVRQRYDEGRQSGYSLIEARDPSGLAGFGAIRHPRAEPDPRLAGLSVAVVSDLLFDPNRREIGFALLERAERAAAGLGADALVCSASHPALLAALSSRGYIRIPATLQFLARLDGGREAGAMSDWWLLRADGNSDEGL